MSAKRLVQQWLTGSWFFPKIIHFVTAEVLQGTCLAPHTSLLLFSHESAVWRADISFHSKSSALCERLAACRHTRISRCIAIHVHYALCLLVINGLWELRSNSICCYQDGFSCTVVIIPPLAVADSTMNFHAQPPLRVCYYASPAARQLIHQSYSREPKE